MCVPVYAYVQLCMYVCMYECVCVCVYVYMYVRMYLCTCVCIYICCQAYHSPTTQPPSYLNNPNTKTRHLAIQYCFISSQITTTNSQFDNLICHFWFDRRNFKEFFQAYSCMRFMFLQVTYPIHLNPFFLCLTNAFVDSIPVILNP